MQTKNNFSFFQKWNIYQSSRFPVIKHSLLILAFSSCAVSYSAMSNGNHQTHFLSYLVAFITCLLFFLQLRIADEFKDYEEDCLYRNYRPVPQGIITLKELKNLFIISGCIQLILAFYLNIKLVPFLFLTWLYLFCMSHEFGIRSWLKAHPISYLLSHMLIMPLIDFYATSTDWINYLSSPAHSLYWFVALSFFNGINLEIGRKIRSPDDEEKGVETYSFLWNRKRACTAWIFAVALTGLCSIGAAFYLNTFFFFTMIIFVSSYLTLCIFMSKSFIKKPFKGRGKTFENLSGIFTLLIYLLLGLIPYFSFLIGK